MFAGDQLGIGQMTDAVQLHGRKGEMTAVAMVAHQPGHRHSPEPGPEPVVRGPQVVWHQLGQLGPPTPQVRQLGVNGRLRLCQTGGRVVASCREAAKFAGELGQAGLGRSPAPPSAPAPGPRGWTPGLSERLTSAARACNSREALTSPPYRRRLTDGGALLRSRPARPRGPPDARRLHPGWWSLRRERPQSGRIPVEGSHLRPFWQVGAAVPALLNGRVDILEAQKGVERHPRSRVHGLARARAGRGGAAGTPGNRRRVSRSWAGCPDRGGAARLGCGVE